MFTRLSPPNATRPALGVIDGDTIELSDGRRVRYIGIDTPETV
jgi:endonuclease YncB( thermonuclease family)